MLSKHRLQLFDLDSETARTLLCVPVQHFVVNCQKQVTAYKL